MDNEDAHSFISKNERRTILFARGRNGVRSKHLLEKLKRGNTETLTSEKRNGVVSKHLLEKLNGATGASDMAGNAARVAVERCGSSARCPVTELMGWARSADRWSFDYHSIRHVYFERTMHAHAVEQCADCSRGCTEID